LFTQKTLTVSYGLSMDIRIRHYLAPEYQHLPSELHSYHTLYPLENSLDRSSKVFGYATSIYKATSQRDGMQYILRRIEGAQSFFFRSHHS